MAATILTISPRTGMKWSPGEVQRLWFFPEGSRYHSSPHWHIILPSGFRQNLPLWTCFVIVQDGKFSIKNYNGDTIQRMTVVDQVWSMRNRPQVKAPEIYSLVFSDDFLKRRPRMYVWELDGAEFADRV